MIVEDIKSFLAEGRSPITGRAFPKLSENYADKKKNGDTTPNLYLEGDLYESLSYERDGDNLIIGVESDQEKKADGHNNFSGNSSLPPRRFLANSDEDQEFKNQNKILLDTLPLYEEDVQDALETYFKALEKATTKQSMASIKEAKKILSNETALPEITETQVNKLKFKQRITPSKGKTEITLGGITKKDIRGLF